MFGAVSFAEANRIWICYVCCEAFIDLESQVQHVLRGNMRIECGIGGPIINYNGEVIGVSFYDNLCTPFLPINIVLKSLDYFKNNGVYCRPWLGIEMTNFYAARLSKIEAVVKTYPDICEGVFVENVVRDSPAHLGGVWPDDVIVECDGQAVRSLLQFWGMIWDKTGNHVQLGLVRKVEGLAERVNLTLAVQEKNPNELNSWPLSKHRMAVVDSLRYNE
ncbi:Trypsin family protein with pdz domain-containing protein, partial [Thalictrum thalictroides]